MKYVDITKIKSFTIVSDPANSMGAQYIEALFKKIPCKLIKMNFNLDGTFPNHQPDPLNAENLIHLQRRVKIEHADLGIATDGDGDRIFFIDETGKIIPSHIIRTFYAKIFLKENPGATICYDIRPGKITREIILKYGGKPVVTPVGHSLIKEKMRKENALFAGESSGHFFLRLKNSYYETPIIMILKLLIELSTSKKTISQLMKPFKKYVHSGEINSTVRNKQKKLQEIASIHRDAKNINYLDGITIEYNDYWFNLRQSNTEPVLRLNLEAINKKIMKQKRDKLLSLIRDS